MSGAKRREGAFNCTYRAATASSKVIRHSMSILGLSAGYVIRRAAHTIDRSACHIWSQHSKYFRQCRNNVVERSFATLRVAHKLLVLCIVNRENFGIKILSHAGLDNYRMKKFGQLIIKTTKIYGPRITRAHCGHVRVLVLYPRNEATYVC